jgi:hypothetical protein
VRPGIFWEYNGYLEIRSPEGAGIKNPLVAMYHRAIPHLGLLAVLLTAFCYVRKNFLLFCLAIPPSLYAIMFTASLASRYTVVLLGAAGAVFLASGRGYRIGGMFLSLAAILSYNICLFMRLNAGSRGTYGLRPFIGTLTNPRFTEQSESVFLLFNIFPGGCNMAYAMLDGPLFYPLSYKLHSFFPGASIMDGFQTLRSHAEQKIGPTTPYGAYSETYLFGVGWFVAYLTLWFISLTMLCRFWERFRGLFGVIVLSLAYVSFAASPVYPIRNSFRLMLFSCILAFIASRWFNLKSTSIRIEDIDSDPSIVA